MAFCTSCGADVQGAFCPQCGAQVGAQPAPQAAPAAPPAMSPAPAAAVAPAARGKIGCLGWGLIVAGSLLVLFMIALASIGSIAAYFVHNPGIALAKIITASNPDAEVLSTDAGSQSMRIRDRKTGDVVTFSFDDIKNGKFKMHSVDKEGKEANLEIGGGAGKLPSWVPTYPGAKAQGNFTARAEGADGMGEGGMVGFTTPDSPSQVISFYQDKAKEMGLTANLNGSTPEGAMFTAVDENTHRTLNIIVGGGKDGTTFTVTYGRKR